MGTSANKTYLSATLIIHGRLLGMGVKIIFAIFCGRSSCYDPLHARTSQHGNPAPKLKTEKAAPHNI